MATDDKIRDEKLQYSFTLSDTGFFELQKHGRGDFCRTSHPNFCSRAAIMFKPGQ